ncbi:MAG: NAD-binding protein [Methyloprofundus sp.]|nr:NAD-binding protein [Methyloprofundus sp.]MDT8426542.1 NAD-binding protein [Methyloprofundus sp.]
MNASQDISRVSFIVMREMRAPLMTILIVYALSILGMVFIPGIEVDGNTQYLSIFHAFYVISYTATTIGFGEIPFAFSDAQRLWMIVCIYAGVVTWFYALGSIVRLFQNRFFLRAVEEWRFSKNVHRISGPFYIVCGFGDTGSVLVRGMNDAGLRAIVIDQSEERIQALKLRNYKTAVPGLCANASIPRYLLEARVQDAMCQGVVCVTNDEEVNLKVSAMVRLLNPQVRIITMSKVDDFEETLSTLGGEVHIVDPFKTFARVLNASINNPAFYALNNWLVGDKGATLTSYVQPPVGGWIICGYGRMGLEANRVLTKNGIKTAVIDPHSRRKEEEIDTYVIGHVNAKTLSQAGIHEAVGLLAADADDGHNLGALLNARCLNKKLFTIVRQNSHENGVAFSVANADMIMQPTLVTARKILLLLIAPLLKPFFRYLLLKEPGREQVLNDLLVLLREKIGDTKPSLATIDFTAEKSSAVIQALEAGEEVLLGHIIADPRNRDVELDLVPFVIKSCGKELVLPPKDYKILEGDQLLFCGTATSKELLKSAINSEYTLYYLRTGRYKPMGYFMQWYDRRFNTA